MKRIACIILNYNDPHNVMKLLSSVKDFDCFSTVVVVDNCSTDNSYDLLAGFCSNKVKLIRSERNGGYGYGNNLGLKYAFNDCGCDYAVIANPDVSFSESLIIDFLEAFKDDASLGLISAVQVDKRGDKVIKSAWRLPTKKQYILSNSVLLSKLTKSFFFTNEELFNEKLKYVGCVAGSLLCLDKDTFLLTGGYDEKVFLYCEETILGFRMASIGKRSAILTDNYYHHIHGATISKTFKQARMRRKLLNSSHKYVLKNYLKANRFERAIDSIFCFFQYVFSFLRK